MHKGGELLSIDIKNAFGCLPFEVIQQTLNRLGLSIPIKTYIMKMLKMRHGDGVTIKCGTA